MATMLPGKPFTWTFSSTPCGNPKPEEFKASMTNTVYANVDATTPLDVVEPIPTCNFGDPGSTVVVPQISTTQDSEMILALFGAAGASQFLTLPGTGSDLIPLVSETNLDQGPAIFNAFANTFDVGVFDNGQFGAAGQYGPFTATQFAHGESLGVILSMISSPSSSPVPTPTHTPTATPTPFLTLSPSTLNFGTVKVGQSSAQSGVTLDNGTGKKVTIHSTMIGRDFKVLVTTCSSVLNAGQSCDYSISFQPQSEGTKHEVFKVDSSSGKNPLKVNLEGVGSRQAPTPTPTGKPKPTRTPVPASLSHRAAVPIILFAPPP
jgi:hypothetical protein